MIFDGNHKNMQIITKINEYMPLLNINTAPHLVNSKKGYCYSFGDVKSDACNTISEASKDLLMKLRQEYKKQVNQETHEL